MNKEKSMLVKRIADNCDTVRRTKAAKDRFADRIESLYAKYGISRDKGFKLLSLQEDLNSCSNWVLYALANVVLSNSVVNEFFTPAEIKEFSNHKSEERVIEIPISMQAIKVADDQWISSTDVRFLTELGNSGLIYYNENTQRALTKVMKDGEERYIITLNKKAVRDIKEAYSEGRYIPNTITLNIPTDAEVEYNEKTGMLTIDNIDHFDILDGYHRYVAFGQLCTTESDFHYPMELRLTQFSETKAKQFIWQEDQKTKMKRIVSDSYNQSTYASQVISVLKSMDPIGPYIGSLIDESILNKTISATRLKSAGKAKRSEVLDCANELAEKAKFLESNDKNLFDSSWDERYIPAFVFAQKESVNDMYDRMLKSGEFESPHLHEADIRRAKRYV